MSEQTLFSRISNWFKNASIGTPPQYGANNDDGNPNEITGVDSLSSHGVTSLDGQNAIEPRSTFLRPWAKRDAAIENLQGGIVAIGDLMSGIKNHLERQSQRQDELLSYLSHLPAAMEQLPESNRVQAETLKAIHEHLKGQNAQQSKLGDILEKISAADGQNGRALDALNQTVDQLRRHDENVAQNLGQVGSAMENLGKNTATSAEVLQQLRDSATSRDGQIERILQQQTNRFTTLLVVATLLLVSALVAVGVIGWLFLRTTGKI